MIDFEILKGLLVWSNSFLNGLREGENGEEFARFLSNEQDWYGRPSWIVRHFQEHESGGDVIMEHRTASGIVVRLSPSYHDRERTPEVFCATYEVELGDLSLCGVWTP